MGQMSIMDVTGDERLSWDALDEVSVHRARNRFKELISQGYKAYRINHVGKAGEPISEFDPFALEIVMRKILAGG